MSIAKPTHVLLRRLVCGAVLMVSSLAFAQAFVPPVLCPEAGECVAENPTPTPTPGVCAVQPTLHLAIVPGAPFTDCGHQDATRIPSPTRMRHGLQEMNGQTTCIMASFVPESWAFPNLPDLRITNSDQIYHNSATFPGDVAFTGQNVVFANTQNGMVLGDVLCGPGANNIEYDSSCTCP